MKIAVPIAVIAFCVIVVSIIICLRREPEKALPPPEQEQPAPPVQQEPAPPVKQQPVPENPAPKSSNLPRPAGSFHFRKDSDSAMEFNNEAFSE